MEETCTVEQRRASSGAFYAALAPDGRLIARSSALDPPTPRPTGVRVPSS